MWSYDSSTFRFLGKRQTVSYYLLFLFFVVVVLVVVAISWAAPAAYGSSQARG